MTASDMNECNVCGAFKFSHEDVCRACDDQRRARREQEQQAKRDRQYGSLWPRER